MRIVVKVGTSTIAHATGRMNIFLVEELCKVLSDIKNIGHEVVLVSSGAIGIGVGKLNLKERPNDIPSKQAAAAVGQCELMYTYDRLFSQYNHVTAQILLSGSDFEKDESHINIKNTLNRLFEMNVIPIINENDTVATNEISIGDNDTLAAVVAESVNADLLVLFTDIDGLYTADPRKDSNAKLLSKVEDLTDEIISLGEGNGTKLGTGGMKTKLCAAKIATDAGIDMVIANGKDPKKLHNIVNGESVGTLFVGRK
ncbi:MAG: glutamate 5-kinase [Oscillospiraceae bacterium]|nr:glutamate 5-kinase [Oscillospiraceae bacterium]